MLETKPATGTQARVIVANRDLESSAVSGIHVLRRIHSFHHRQLRSQSGPDTPDNLVLLDGTGTTGEHGWVHAHPTAATILGLIVPSWSTPAEWPIYRRDPYGIGWAWWLQTPDGQLDGRAPTIDAIAAINGIEAHDVDDAIAAFRDLVTETRAGLR